MHLPKTAWIALALGALLARADEPQPGWAPGSVDPSLPRLGVRVVGPLGEPCGATSAGWARGLMDPFDSDWPTKPTVLVTKAPEAMGALDDPSRPLLGRVDESGELEFGLPEPGEYLVTLMAPGQALQSRRVSVAEGATRAQLAFALDEPRATGALRVEVVDPAGRVLRDRIALRLIAPDTGARLFERRVVSGISSGPTSPASFELPFGEYIVEALSLPQLDWHGRLDSPATLGGGRAPVVVLAGGAQELRVELTEPAWIDLEIEGAPSAADVEAFQRRHAGGVPSIAAYEALGFGPHLAGVRLIPREGFPIPVHFARYGMGGSTAAGTHLFSTLPLDSRSISEVLTPGEYRLVVELAGGRSVERALVLLPGETVEVYVAFGAQ